MGRFFSDARYGVRMLLKTPAWTAVMVATLALGIGLATAIFSVVYSVLLRPLPYPEPGRLVALWSQGVHQRFNVSAANWRDWRAQSQSLQDIAITRPIANFNLTGDGPPERLQGARTSWNLPQVLAVRPLLGRVFTEEEQLRDARVAMLSYAFWKRRFGGDPSLVGRKLQLNGEAFEVIGVMPPDYQYPTRDFELWTPLYIRPDEVRTRMGHDYLSVGRLKPGLTIERAQTEMSAIMQRIVEQYPAIYRKPAQGVLLEPLLDSTVRDVRTTLFVLQGAVGSLLLIGCMNLGVLLLARASARSREMVVRAALGASPVRLRGQMLAELMPLSVAGAAGGALLAQWMLSALLPLLPAEIPRVESIGLHGPVLGFAVALSVLVVIAAGLLPARFASRAYLGSRTVAAGGRAQNVLVMAQVAVTLVLLFGGGLFARSLVALLQVNPGFTTGGVLTLHLAVTRAKYPQDRQVAEYYDRILDRVRAAPGILAAGIVNRLPLSGVAQTGGVEFENKPEIGYVNADWRSATPGYFEAIGIPLKRGRLFTASDRENAPLAGLIDEQLARKVFGGSDPIGKRFRDSAGGVHGPWTQIAGVVGHILNEGLEKDARPQVYWPEAQRAQDRAVLVVRTAGHPESFASAVVERIRSENSDQTVYYVRSMEEWKKQSLGTRNLMTGLVGLFGGASLLLACLGLYGVVSYAARLRMREFGIRMALGAPSGHVRRLVLVCAGRLALGGSAIGLALAWPVARSLQSFLYGVSSGDSVVLVTAPVVLLAAALLAGLGPARRASRIDPAITLRAE
jgi:putative ABC transport system permease protein